MILGMRYYQVNEVLPASTKTDKEQSLCWKHGVFTKKQSFPKQNTNHCFCVSEIWVQCKLKTESCTGLKFRKHWVFNHSWCFRGLDGKRDIFSKDRLPLKGFDVVLVGIGNGTSWSCKSLGTSIDELGGAFTHLYTFVMFTSFEGRFAHFFSIFVSIGWLDCRLLVDSCSKKGKWQWLGRAEGWKPIHCAIRVAEAAVAEVENECRLMLVELVSCHHLPRSTNASFLFSRPLRRSLCPELLTSPHHGTTSSLWISHLYIRGHSFVDLMEAELPFFFAVSSR